MSQVDLLFISIDLVPSVQMMLIASNVYKKTLCFLWFAHLHVIRFPTYFFYIPEV